MYSKEEQIKVYVMIGTIIMLLVIFSGITYAFFSASNNQGSTSLIEATSGKMLISYKDGTSDLLVSKDIQPSDNIIIDKTFTLTGTNTTSGLVMPYKIGIKYTSGFSNGQLHYYIKRTTTNSNVTSKLIGTANQPISGNTSETGYTTGIFIKNNTESYLELANGEFKENTSNQTITFNLKIQFPDTNENQDSEKGASFIGNIVVNYENETGVDYIARLYNGDKESNGLLADDTKDANIRYSGSNPNNYVEFGNSGELWRIIGIFNVTDSNGITSQKLKIVRNDSLGSYSWDTSKNNNYGFNDWTNADLMKELNGDYLDTTLTAADERKWYNSYWDSSIKLSQVKFDYTKVVKEKYQNMISETVWNIGGNTFNPTTDPQGLLTIEQYNAERGSNVYTGDSITRATTWIGKVGLIYASDYGYASTNEECRKDMKSGQVYDTSTKTYNYANMKCKENNWLFKKTRYFTLSPSSARNSIIFAIHDTGNVGVNDGFNSYSVFTSTYLKSDINFISGTGTQSDPYKLG